MRIAFACIRYPPAPGGAESHAHALAKRFVARGHEVVVHTSDLLTEYPFRRASLPDEVDGVRVVRHRAVRVLGAWTAMPAMWRALREERYDILHAHSYGYFQTIAAARSAAHNGKPFVFTPHFHPPWSMEGGGARRLLRRVYDPTLGSFALARADRVIGVSSGEMREMRKYLPLDPSKAIVIPNGFDAQRFDPVPDGAAFRSRLGIAPTAPLVLFAGRLASNKGLHHLVPAFARVANDIPEAWLVLAGQDQGWRARLEALAASLGVQERVRFVGHLSDEEYPRALASADVLALPSEWEAFGIVLAEAMACRVPCVATNVGGAPDVVVDDVTGLLVPYAEEPALAAALTRLLDDAELRRRMGEAGRERALRHFSWDAVADRTLELYAELLKE